MSNKLTEMIDQLVLEKTVSLDALNAINELKKHAQALDDELRASERGHKHDAETIRQLRDQISEMNVQHQSIVKMLEQERQRVESMQQAEQQGKEAKAELKGFTEAMHMVFRPSVVRETFQKRVPVPVEGSPGGNGSYPTPGFVVESNETGSVTRTQE